MVFCTCSVNVKWNVKRCGLCGKETEDHNKRTSQEKRQYGQYGLNTRKLKCNDKIKIHTGERTEPNQ